MWDQPLDFWVWLDRQFQVSLVIICNPEPSLLNNIRDCQ